MRLYRIHFLDAAGNVTRCHSVRLSTDAAAVTVGRQMLANHNPGCAVDIWHRNRLVHHEGKAKTAAAS